jgi:hypothetical protein
MVKREALLPIIYRYEGDEEDKTKYKQLITSLWYHVPSYVADTLKTTDSIGGFRLASHGVIPSFPLQSFGCGPDFPCPLLACKLRCSCLEYQTKGDRL